MSTFIWDDCQLSQGGIQYNENYKNYTINIPREGGGNATRQLACAWGDAIDLATSLRGNTVEINNILVYTEAAAHPLLPQLKVSNVSITPVGKPIETGVFEQAFLDLTYDVPEFGGSGGGPDDEELAEESLDFTAVNQQIPAAKGKFESGQVLDEDFFTTVRLVEYRKTLYKQASLPLSAIVSLINKVNNSNWEGVSEGKALYAGATASRVRTAEGNKEWTISHVVLVGQQDHRTRWNKDTGQFEIVNLDDGTPIIESGSFSSVGL